MARILPARRLPVITPPICLQSAQGTVGAAATTWIWGGTAAFDPVVSTDYYKTGTQSIKMVVLAADAGGRRIDRQGVSWVWSTYKGIIIRLYALTQTNRLSGAYTINLSKDAAGTFTNYFTVTFDQIKHGWNVIAIPREDFTVGGGSIAWTDTLTNFRFTVNKKSDDQTIYFDGLFALGHQRPQVALTFDDGWLSQNAIADYCNASSVPCTFFIIPDLLGGALYLSADQVRAINANKLFAICTHGEDRWDIASSTERAIVDAIEATRPYTSNYNARFAAWPNGEYGYTGAATAATFAAAQKAGMIGGRGVSKNIHCGQLGDSEPYSTVSVLLDNAMTLAAAKALIDDAILTGSSVCFCGHKIGDTADSLTWVTTDFYALVDYIATKRAAGLLDAVTFPEWHSRLIS